MRSTAPGARSSSARACRHAPQNCRCTFGAQEWFIIAARGYIPKPSRSPGPECLGGTTAMALMCTCTARARLSSTHRVGQKCCFAVSRTAPCLPQGLEHRGCWQLGAARSHAAQQSLLHQLFCRHGMHMGVQRAQPVCILALFQRCKLHCQDHQLWQHPRPWPATGSTAWPMPAVCLPVRKAAIPNQRACRTRDASMLWQWLQAVVACLQHVHGCLWWGVGQTCRLSQGMWAGRTLLR